MNKHYWIERWNQWTSKWQFVPGTCEQKSWVLGYFACLKDITGKRTGYRLVNGRWPGQIDEIMDTCKICLN